MVDVTDIAAHRARRHPPAPPPDDPEIERSRSKQALLRQTHQLIEFVGPAEAVRITWEAFKVCVRALRSERNQ